MGKIRLAAASCGLPVAIVPPDFPRRFKRLDGLWSAMQITLEGVTSLCGEKLHLHFRFHTLGNQGETQGLSQADDGADDGRIVRIDQHVADEGSIDFQLTQRQSYCAPLRLKRPAELLA